MQPIRFPGSLASILVASLLWVGAASAADPLPFTIIGFGGGWNYATDQPVPAMYQSLDDAGIDLLIPAPARQLTRARNAALAMKTLATTTQFTMRDIAYYDYPYSPPEGAPPTDPINVVTHNHGFWAHLECPGNCWKDDVQQILDLVDFANNPSVASWFVWDEPASPQNFLSIDAMSDLVTGAGKIPYTNLLPISGMDGDDPARHAALIALCGNSTTEVMYNCYIDRYLDGLDTTQPPLMVSADDYPFYVEGQMKTDFFWGLRLLRDQATAHSTPQWRVPMWRFVQLSRDLTSPTYHEPTMPEVKWQIYTALAYGAKGIGYFTLVKLQRAPNPSLPDDPDVIWPFGPGILDVDGAGNWSQTSRYTPIQTLNQELHQLGKRLIDLDCLATYHQDSIGQRGIANDLLGSGQIAYNIVASMTTRESGIVTAPQEGMFGYLKHHVTGEDYLLVVNKNSADGEIRDITVNLTNAPAGVLRVSKTNGSFTLVPMDDADSFTLQLGPGEGELVKICKWSLRTVDAVGNTGRYASLALDAQGGPQIAYQGGSADSRVLFATPASYGWPTTELTTSAGSQVTHAIDGQQNNHVAYVIGGGYLSYRMRTSGAWSSTVNIDNCGSGIKYSTLRRSTTNFPYIAYMKAAGPTTAETLKYAYKTPTGWGRLRVPTGYSGSMQSMSMRLNAQNQPIIVYSTTMNYAYSSAEGLLTTLGNAADVSLALDGAGNPRVAYWDPVAKALKFASKSGLQWTVETIDAGANAGGGPCLELDGSGNPRISYHRDGALRYARRIGTNWDLTVVDNLAGLSSDPGRRASLALNASGNPIIAYYDAVNGDLKYAVPKDETAPAACFGVNAAFGNTTATVSWFVSGDDGMSGQAVAAEVRYATFPLTDNSFSSGILVSTQAPGPVYTQHCADLSWLGCGAPLYFAAKVCDEALNWSPVSEVYSSTPNCSAWYEVTCEGGGGWLQSRNTGTDEGALPTLVELVRLSPNPARAGTSLPIEFGIPRAHRGARISLTIFDVTGRVVRSLDAGNVEPGRHVRFWDTKTEDGQRARQGMYFVRLRVGDIVVRRSIVLF